MIRVLERVVCMYVCMNELLILCYRLIKVWDFNAMKQFGWTSENNLLTLVSN